MGEAPMPLKPAVFLGAPWRLGGLGAYLFMTSRSWVLGEEPALRPFGPFDKLRSRESSSNGNGHSVTLQSSSSSSSSNINKESARPDAMRASEAKAEVDGEVNSFLGLWKELYEKQYETLLLSPSDRKAASELIGRLKTDDPETWSPILKRFLADREKFFVERRHQLHLLPNQLQRFVVNEPRRQVPKPRKVV
jgi:hypothetical protein